MTFACRTCQLVLHDGVDYTWCPKCNGTVDWIDGRFHVWTCATCDLLVNKKFVPNDACPNCNDPLAHISGPLPADQVTPAPSMFSTARKLLIALLVMQAIFAVFDPDAFPYLGPLLVFCQIAAVGMIARLVGGSRELRALAGDRSTRIIHGLEHATANVLEERGLQILRGQTTDGMFTLDIVHDGKHYEGLETTVADATADAVSRIRFGERDLAFDPRCGTSQLVAATLLGLAIVGAGIAGLALDVPAGTTFAFTVAAGLAARVLARSAGLAAQRWLTVSIDFASAVVTRVDTRISSDGEVVTAVVMIDVIPRAVDISAVAPVPL